MTDTPMTALAEGESTAPESALEQIDGVDSGSPDLGAPSGEESTIDAVDIEVDTEVELAETELIEVEADADAAEAGADADAAEAGAADSTGPASGGSRKRSRVESLEREGEVAADFLERLLDIADLDGDIDVDIDGDRAAVAVVDSEEGRVPRRLVGPEGRVLEALQELTRLAVQTATGERSRLMLDVAGFRAERRTTLVRLAQAAITEVRESGVAKTLADMPAFERKVVHDEVTAAGLTSESEGVEPHRHIVISPA